MFGRLTAVRLKTAEDALDDGRIDEAFQIAAAPDLAGHRRVQRLLNRLVEPLLKRGQEHLLSRRFDEALADFDRAARCGHQSDKAAEWRTRAIQAMNEARQHDRDRQQALAAAHERMAAGSLNGAASALAQIPTDDLDRQRLDRQIDRMREMASRAFEAAQAALDRDDFEEALRNLRKTRELFPRLEGTMELERKLLGRVFSYASQDLGSGQLGRLAHRLAMLGDVGRRDASRRNLEEALQLAHQAAAAVADHRYAKANVLLGRLAALAPYANWIANARKHLDELEDHRKALLEGPLGLLAGRNVPSEIGMSVPGQNETIAAPSAAPTTAPPIVAAAPTAANRFILRIDGVGSYLLLRRDRVAIGRAGPDATADLPLISDLTERQAEIVRAGEDYFIMAASGVELAGRPVEHALLQDGDRIRLGRRIRIKFARPSLKSNTAVLDLGEGVRTETECRRVILWGGPLLLGGTRECHVPLPTGRAGAVLLDRGGQLFIKPIGPGGSTTPVVMGQAFEFDGVRMRLAVWHRFPTGEGRVIG